MGIIRVGQFNQEIVTEMKGNIIENDLASIINTALKDASVYFSDYKNRIGV